MIRPRIKPVTAAEFKVIFISLATLLILVGSAGLVAGFLAPSDKQELAKLAILYGGGAIGVGALLFLALWSICRWTGS